MLDWLFGKAKHQKEADKGTPGSPRSYRCEECGDDIGTSKAGLCDACESEKWKAIYRARRNHY